LIVYGNKKKNFKRGDDDKQLIVDFLVHHIKKP